MDTPLYLRLIAKAPVNSASDYPDQVHLTFSPDVDGDNSAWAPAGVQPSLSLSLITTAALVEGLQVGQPYEMTLTPVGVSPAEGPPTPGLDPAGQTRAAGTDTGTEQTSGSDESPVTSEPDPAPKRKH